MTASPGRPSREQPHHLDICKCTVLVIITFKVCVHLRVREKGGRREGEAHVRLKKSDDGLRSQECCLSPFRNNFLLASHSTNYVMQLNSKSRNSPLVPASPVLRLSIYATVHSSFSLGSGRLNLSSGLPGEHFTN